jgi:hypothetical protein
MIKVIVKRYNILKKYKEKIILQQLYVLMINKLLQFWRH